MFDFNRLLNALSARAGTSAQFQRMLEWKLLRGSHEFPGPDGGTCVNEAAVVAELFARYADGGVAIGELARREREQRQRQELRQADETEVERPVANRVDLPADCDDDHLRRESVREQRGPEERESAHTESRGQTLPHGPER